MTTTATRKHTRKPMSAAKREQAAAARKEQAEALQAGLAAQVAEMASGAAWRDYLDFAGNFHRYSLRNTLLIMVQHPTATSVAGYKAWQERGRQVIKGEKAIRIYGFAQKKVEDEVTKEVTYQTYFPIVSVFAEDQTAPITDDMIADIRKANPKAITFAEAPVNPTQRLQGTDDTDILGRVAAFVEGNGWEFAIEAVGGGANGFTTIDGTKRVVVEANLAPAQQAKTALHEAAHMILHTDEEGMVLDRATKELEAESASYVASKMLGLDSEGYSIGYLTGWSQGNPDAVKATAERVLKAAHRIIEALDPTDD
ncbi:peptidase [Gordonia phage RedWattleHog]|uniref:Metallopeptidase domain protein n=1 Tax=Gordonia phage Stormageddon TaxID=2656541 RepID=A0A649VRX7_9CAUD|nr:metallopeptidase domain protein [Gordonia phage Stormageddon]QGJ95058.1 metallopeptidase domain protein [Gordonia phage Stormageddon]QLF83700.1 peptidase [Gordonia phage RedWattleHog]